VPAATLRLLIIFSLTSCLAAPAVTHAAPQGSISYDSRVMNQNRVGLTVTNFGFIGNNFTTPAPSMEYPLGTGFEHLVVGGLWIGANAVDDLGAFTGVSTAVLDGAVATNPSLGTEFTPTGNDVIRRSTITTSQFYSPDAISELDAIGSFSDLPSKVTSHGPSRPLSVNVRQIHHSWSAPEHGDFIICRFVIQNVGPPLTNMWVGLYTELASGPKNSYSSWPPLSSGSPYGSWYRKALLAYDEDLRMIREHRCSAPPIPDGCQFEITPYWAGVKLLTAPEKGQSVTLAAWDYSPGNSARDEDTEQYAILSAGTIQNLSAPELQPGSGDPIELLGIGPFAHLDTGDSITVDFALVGGAEVADIQTHAMAAQALYDGVVPTLVSLADARASDGIVRVAWHSATLERAAVMRREPGTAWERTGDVRADGVGRLTYEDRDVRPGHRYAYALRLIDEPAALLGEVWVDVPAGVGFALFGAQPVAGMGAGIDVRFALDRAASGDLMLVDVAGRVRARTGLEGLSSGSHTLRLGVGQPLAPGIYFVRLAHAGRTANTKLVIAQ